MTRLNYVKNLLLPIALLVAGNSIAQQMSKEQLRNEMFKDMLREKIHAPYNAAGNSQEEELAKTTGSDSRISSTGTGVDEAEVSVAINPSDSNQLVISYMEESTTGLNFPIYYSSNGGQTWTRSSFNALSIAGADYPGQSLLGGGDPAFAWDKNGRLYFSWIYLTGLGGPSDTAFFTLNWAYSDNNGTTWSIQPGAKHFIGSGAYDGSGNILNYHDGVTDREWLGIDNSGGAHQGRLYCSFVCFGANGNTFEGLKYKDHDSTSFSSMSTIYNNVAQFGNVEVDKNGVVHASMGDLVNTQIIHASSSNGGVTFSAPHVVANANNIFPQGGPYVVHNRENAAPNLAVDNAANLHLVWTDFVTGSSTTGYYSRSTNGGVTWSTPVVLDTFFTSKETFMPTVAAAGNNVAISFTALNFAIDSASYYQVNSTNNGQTFGKPKLLSSASTDYQNYPTNTSSIFFGDYNRSVRNPCKTFAGWSDGRNNLGPKVYFAKTDYCSVGVPEITAVNGSLQVKALYPNPATNKVTLDITSNKNQKIMLTLTDMTGKKLMSQASTLNQGSQQVSISLNNIAIGSYILSINDADGVVTTRHIQVD